MINPGVLVLGKKTIGKTYTCIEDNIGESIHFHYGNLRMDFSINEFLEFSNKLYNAAMELLGDISLELQIYDPVFLNYISHHLCGLEKIEDDEIELKDIICYGYAAKNVLGPVHLDKSSRYLALKGNTELYESIDRDKPLFMSHLERLNSIRKFILESNNIGNIVLLNDTSVILDGQHRAACMYFDFGNKRIPIKRFYFKDYNLNYKVHGKCFYSFKRIKKTIKNLIRATIRR